MKRARSEARALAIDGKGTTLADSSPLTFLVGDRSYEAKSPWTSRRRQAGICLFYSERMFCGIGFSNSQMFTYNTAWNTAGCARTWQPEHATARDNHANIVTFYYQRNGETWVKHPWQMEVSGYHHNVFGGFSQPQVGVYCVGTGK